MSRVEPAAAERHALSAPPSQRVCDHAHHVRAEDGVAPQRRTRACRLLPGESERRDGLEGGEPPGQGHGRASAGEHLLRVACIHDRVRRNDGDARALRGTGHARRNRRVQRERARVANRAAIELAQRVARHDERRRVRHGREELHLGAREQPQRGRGRADELRREGEVVVGALSVLHQAKGCSIEREGRQGCELRSEPELPFFTAPRRHSRRWNALLR